MLIIPAPRCVLLPDGGPPRDPASYYSVSGPVGSVISTVPGSRPVRQPGGTGKPLATAGPEIWADTEQGHPFRGWHRHRQYIWPVPQRRCPGPVRIVGADPEDRSIRAVPADRIWSRVGEDFWPAAYDPSVPGEIIAVSDSDSFRHDQAAGPRRSDDGRRVVRDGSGCRAQVAEKPGPTR